MLQSIKAFLTKGYDAYINLAWRLRRRLKWKKLHSVYVNVDNDLVTEPIFKTIMQGSYEVDENKILRRTFTPDDVLLELGTGIGFNSIYCAKINGGKVRTYEGNPNLLPLIRKNMQKNNTDFAVKNEIVVSKAGAPPAVSFNIVRDFWTSSSKKVENIVETVAVPTADINGILREWKPTYLMTDIEGGEAEVFDDCAWLVNTPVKKIMIELHADVIGEDGCFRVMNNIVQAGFKMDFDGTPKNVVYFYR